MLSISNQQTFPLWSENNVQGKYYITAFGNNLKSFSQTTTLFGSLSGTVKWQGGVLAPDGKIYGIPYNSTQVLEIGTALPSNLPNNQVLSRYINKY